MVPLFVLFCMPGETRDLGMLYIVLLILIAANLARAEGATPDEPQELFVDTLT
jgi:hypothetical protein